MPFAAFQQQESENGRFRRVFPRCPHPQHRHRRLGDWSHSGYPSFMPDERTKEIALSNCSSFFIYERIWLWLSKKYSMLTLKARFWFILCWVYSSACLSEQSQICWWWSRRIKPSLNSKRKTPLLLCSTTSAGNYDNRSPVRFYFLSRVWNSLSYMITYIGRSCCPRTGGFLFVNDMFSFLRCP